VPLAYFFFDGRDSQSELQRHDKLIRSLISQFSHQRGGIPTELADLYKRCGDHQQPSVNQLQNTLQDILDGFSHAYIVIDALDECVDRGKTLNWVHSLVADRKVENLHIVVTSRLERDIEEAFMAFDSHPIDVVEESSNLDILKYLELQMRSRFFQKYNEKTQKEIEFRLRERADGSYVYFHQIVHRGIVADIAARFRWVALQLAELKNCLSEHEIMQQLENLPKDLDNIYKRILESIDRKYSADTMTFLQWLAFSRRPMEMAEIAEAITVDFSLEDEPVFNPKRRYKNPRDVLVRCSSLVTESGG
jgi:hypothetical protein